MLTSFFNLLFLFWHATSFLDRTGHLRQLGVCVDVLGVSVGVSTRTSSKGNCASFAAIPLGPGTDGRMNGSLLSIGAPLSSSGSGPVLRGFFVAVSSIVSRNT